MSLSGKKILLEKIPILWNHIKFKYKSMFRNIFRHKKNLILTIIGVSGSTALLLAGFAIKDSIDYAGNYQYTQMMEYDLELSIEEGSTIDEISQYENIYLSGTTAKYDNQYISVVVPSNTEDFNNFLSFKDDDQEPFEMDENSFIVTRQFAVKNDLESGDEISITINNIDETFTISNIADYYFGNYIYIAKEYYTQYYSESLNKIYAKTGISSTDEQDQLYDTLKENSNVLQILFSDDLKASFTRTSNSMNAIIVVLVVSSCALAITVIYNLTLINISSREREIATLKVLGYQENEVSGYVFRETMLS